MTDKNKNFAVPTSKVLKSKRPSTVSVVKTSQKGSSTSKEKNVVRCKNKNTTITSDMDMSVLKSEGSMPDYDSEYRVIAYGKFLRALLEESLVDEKIEREETQIDIQMSQLADRFQKTMDQLDKTNRRLKDINFIVEHKRLLDLKSNDCSQIYQMTEQSNTQDVLKDLAATEQACLDKLQTKNVDFGYNKESGHKQLLDAVNDAIEGLEQIKKHSNLDMAKFKEYEKSKKSLEDLQKDRYDLDSLKTDFEKKFPVLSEKLLKEASEKIAKMFENDDD